MAKLLILQLSDIHIATRRNPILSRTDRIRDALRCLDHDIDNCILVISGDIAFSGQADEYEHAYYLIESIRDGIKEVFKHITDVPLIMVPGNHDCFIPNEAMHAPIRKVVLDSFGIDATKINEEIIEECVRPQEQYFRLLRNIFDSDAPQDFTNINSNYYLSIADKQVLVQCFNTAWMVRRDRSQEGSLVYPINSIKRPERKKYDLVISVFHHPYNWLQSDNAREFKSLIQSTSHLVFTGHEHGMERTSVTTSHQEQIQYFEGGVLQNSYDDNQSSFNAVVIRFEAADIEKKITQFVWKSDFYDVGPGSENTYSSLPLSLLRQQAGLSPSHQYLETLQDAGANFFHKVRGKLTLDDTFINLKLRETSLDDIAVNEPSTYLKVSDLNNEILHNKCTIISGDSKSGKSSIRRRLYKSCLEKGLIPCAIDGKLAKVRTDAQIDESIKDEFVQQYSPEIYVRYQQLAKERKIILVDDFQLLAVNSNRQVEVVDYLADRYQHIVIFLNSYASVLDEINLAQIGTETKHFSIEPLNYSLREDVIQKWILMGDDGIIDKTELLTRIDSARSAVDTVIGDRYVPPYPFFVLSILQVYDEGTPINTESTSHGMGYFYERLIKSALTKALERMEISGALTYLGYIAFSFYKMKSRVVTETDMRRLHRAYCEDYEIDEGAFPYENIIELFIKADMLERSTSKISFKYDQNYFYFVASYFSERLNQDDIQAYVQDLCDNLYIQDNADIMLFLAHLSRNSVVINSLLIAARKVFQLIQPTDLSNLEC